MSFSEKLQNLRKEKKYSQEELADLLDVTRQSVSKWESGQTYPEMDKLLSLCKIFNCTLDELTNDNIKEISSEKKTGINTVIDSVLDLVTKTYKMITNMKFKELVRCIFLMVIVASVLSMFSIPLSYFKSSLYQVLISFGSNSVTTLIYSLINFLLNVIYGIIYILLFVHIFKIGFLDKYEFVEVDHNKKVTDEKEITTTEITTKEEMKKIYKEEKIIRKEKETNYMFFDFLGKMTMFFIKFILLFFIIPFIFIFIGLFALLVIDIYFIFTGITYFSILLFIIFDILLTFLVIEFIIKIIFDKRHNFKRIIIIFITGITGLGIASGILVLDIHKTKIIKIMPQDIKTINKVYEYKYQEGMFFEYFNQDIEYIIDDSLKENIDIEILTYEGMDNINFSKLNNGYYINHHYADAKFVMEMIDFFLNGLKDNKLYNINSKDFNKITITSSEKTINKLKDNLNTYYYEQEIEENQYREYQDEINSLYEKNNILEEKYNILNEEKDNLKYELEEYKERVKEIINN